MLPNFGALFKEHGIKFFFMIPGLVKRRLVPVSYKKGFIKVNERGFWEPRSSPIKSLKTASRIFKQIKGKVIIEIGSGIQGHTSGNSIIYWATKTGASKVVALDLDEKEIQLVKNATAKYSHVEALVQDGIEYARNFNGKIDLLYLDFWTPDKDGELPGSGRAREYLRAYEAAKDKLNDNAMILIDDTDHVHPWKHTYIIPTAREDGFQVIYTGRQTLMLRKK